MNWFTNEEWAEYRILIFLYSVHNLYVCHICVIGLDEGEQSSSDPASVQGAYLAFLQLRHLRLRDLSRTVSSNSGLFDSK